MLPPPPLSLSAPELSAELPSAPLLKRSVSSTELLYEKAMARFYKAIELEEQEELKRKSNCCVSAECISGPLWRSKRDSVGNSIERGLERKSSLRRRLSGEIPDISIKIASMKRSKENIAAPIKTLYPQESLDDPDYLSHMEDYTDDYTESTASSEESETEKFKRRVREFGAQKRPITEDELDTYHPRNRMSSPYTSPDSDQAVEVLTIPYSLPDPEFIPKPILKRPSSVEGDSDDKRAKITHSKVKTRKAFSKLFDRNGPSEGDVEDKATLQSTSREAVKPKAEVDSPAPSERRDSSMAREKDKLLKMEMRQSSTEEQKVAIDHYSDLVREVGNWRTTTLPLYLNADELKKAAGDTEDQPEDLQFNQDNFGHIEKAQKNKQQSSPSIAVDEVKIKYCKGQSEEDSSANSAQCNEISLISHDHIHGEIIRQSECKESTSRPRGGSRNLSATRRTSRTPVEARVASKTRDRSTSKSPLSVNRRPLAMKSQGEEKTRIARRTPTPSLSRPITPQEELQQQEDINIKVKSTMSYSTDLVLFMVACWVYLFKDARLAMPIVFLLVYRHISEHLPQWMLRKSG